MKGWELVAGVILHLKNKLINAAKSEVIQLVSSFKFNKISPCVIFAF